MGFGQSTISCNLFLDLITENSQVGWEDHLYTILIQVCGPKQLQGCLPWRGKMLANTLEVTFHISVDKESHLRGTTVQKARITGTKM